MAENYNRYLHILHILSVSIMCSYLEFGKPLVSITDASLTKRLCNVFNPGGNLVKYDICVQIYIFLTKSQVDTN